MNESAESKKDGPLKAAMSVVLKANNVVVAEVDDPILWNEVFSAINLGNSRLAPPAAALPTASASLQAADPAVTAAVANTPAIEPIDKLAKEVGVSLDVLVAACEPMSIEPYARIDIHHWEKMKKDLPVRGPKAMPPIVLTATILCLWNRHAGFGSVTQAQAQNVLGGLGVRDNNPGRGIAGCDWLQQKPGALVVLNPAKVSKAICVTSCFCTQDWEPWKAL
ncbi:hypothetical protein [Xanthomonas arboricola]|uniref:hypothetical protein n=1 Tax=Xanthomonas arboricola TaxID=56448 RepID=UPI0012691BC7|nr:hypothetical protein [Xanthomonas arboricola]UQQ14147.1 hypothetical protein KPG65_16750 [Xanthomonas arboricola pv. corylina]